MATEKTQKQHPGDHAAVPALRVLAADQVRQALPMSVAIAAMRTAFAVLSDGEASMPQRTHIDMTDPPGTALFMASALPTTGALGVKTVTLFGENRACGMPLLQGLFCLFESRHGSPVAILDAASLTALRTGAVSGLATDLLARPDAQNVTIFGAGVQGRTQLVAVSSVRPIRQATVCDVDSAAARCFADQMSEELQLPVTVAGSSADAVHKADIICTATVAREPVFVDRDLPPGVHINAVGSYQPHVQEIPTATVQRARIVLDHRQSALAETGDLLIPLAAGALTRDQLDAELGDVVTGKTVGRRAADEVTLFKSVGLAVQDLVAAQVALTRAERQGLGTVVSL